MFTLPGSSDLQLPREKESILPWAIEVTRRVNRRIRGPQVVESFGDIFIRPSEEPDDPPLPCKFTIGNIVTSAGTGTTFTHNHPGSAVVAFSGGTPNASVGIKVLTVASETDPCLTVPPGLWSVVLQLAFQVPVSNGSDYFPKMYVSTSPAIVYPYILPRCKVKASGGVVTPQCWFQESMGQANIQDIAMVRFMERAGLLNTPSDTDITLELSVPLAGSWYEVSSGLTKSIDDWPVSIVTTLETTGNLIFTKLGEYIAP